MATADKLELVEEKLNVDKQRAVTGRVRITTETELTEEIAHATLAGERVEVICEPIGEEVSSIPKTRVEGDVTIIPVVEEIVVAEKRLVLSRESASARSGRQKMCSYR